MTAVRYDDDGVMRQRAPTPLEKPVSVASMGVGYVHAHHLADLGRLSAADLAARFPTFTGRLFGVVSMIYSGAHPEHALDNMLLGTENLIGFEAIHCLYCSARYTERRRDICIPQTS